MRPFDCFTFQSAETFRSAEVKVEHYSFIIGTKFRSCRGTLPWIQTVLFTVSCNFRKNNWLLSGCLSHILCSKSVLNDLHYSGYVIANVHYTCIHMMQFWESMLIHLSQWWSRFCLLVSHTTDESLNCSTCYSSSTQIIILCSTLAIAPLMIVSHINNC